MMPRKTISVDALRKQVNTMLDESSEGDDQARLAMASVLEWVLTETGQYKGYGYSANLPAGDDPDYSRRYYY